MHFSVRQNVRLQASIEDEDFSLQELSHAIVHAPRTDAVPIWRAFVRTKRGQVMRQTRTVRPRPRSVVPSDAQRTMPLAIIRPYPAR